MVPGQRTESGPKNRFGSGFGKPKMPTVTFSSELLKQAQVLPFFFKSLKIDACFLDNPAGEWASDEFYLAAKAKVKQRLVVNDLAERGVKLTSDFLASAKIEDRFQSNLQVVECNRKKYQKLRLKKYKISASFDTGL